MPARYARARLDLAAPAYKFQSLVERLEQFGGLFEFSVWLADDFAVHGLEGVFSRDAVEPALLRQLFVIGKIEPHEDAYVGAGIGFVRLCG